MQILALAAHMHDIILLLAGLKNVGDSTGATFIVGALRINKLVIVLHD